MIHIFGINGFSELALNWRWPYNNLNLTQKAKATLFIEAKNNPEELQQKSQNDPHHNLFV